MCCWHASIPRRGTSFNYSVTRKMLSFTLYSLCITGINAAVLNPGLFARDTSAVPAIYQVSQQQWASLNKTVGGRLARGRPVAAPCYAMYNGSLNTQVDLNECSTIQQNRKDSTFLANHIGGFEEVSQMSSALETRLTKIAGRMGCLPINLRQLSPRLQSSCRPHQPTCRQLPTRPSSSVLHKCS